MIPRSIRVCMPNLVAVRRSCQKKGGTGTDRQTDRQAGRRAGGQAGRRAGGHTDGRTDGRTDRQTEEETLQLYIVYDYLTLLNSYKWIIKT